MKSAKRSPEEVAREWKQLQQRPSIDRDRQELLYEVSVYHEELVVQNEALVRTQSALEETRDRFVELYDHAPYGYLTFDRSGILRQCNLTAAALIGKPREAIEGRRMLTLVASEDRRPCLEFIRRCRTARDVHVECELTILTGSGPRRVQLLCRLDQSAPSATREFQTSLVDITDRARLESERARITRDHAALAVRLISIQDEERQRIAQNLHDDIGQQVTALRLKLDELAVEIAPRSRTIARAQEMLETLDRRIHFVANELRPPALDLGIVAAIEHFVREWSKVFGTGASFHAAGTERMTVAPVVETQLYRIAQEALNNVAKHAGAQRVLVSLERHEDLLQLRIQDDGRGFDAAGFRNGGEGLGLVGMRERSHLIGSRLDIRSTLGRGVSIVVSVPGDRWRRL